MSELILIVEDEQDCAELLRYNLHKEGYRTIIAQSGEEAVNAARSHTPDAVLLDVMLPELSGWEVCLLLRESAGGKATPIIMLTALSDDEARVKGLGLGADDYLSKPYSVKELLLRLRRQLDRQQALNGLTARAQEQDTAMRCMLHEIRNSISTIGGFSSLALRKGETNRYLQTIHTAAIHTESLLSDASFLSRLERENGRLPLEEVDLDPVVREAIEFLDEAAEKSNVEIAAADSPHLTVRGNRTAVRQVLINLISNAVKYNRPGGTVRVSLTERQGRVDVSIRDEGPGIPPSDMDRIFEKFYRASGSERRQGSGLGLYIVKRLVEAMGGSVTVASQAGRGSMFTASFAKAGAATTLPARDVA